MKRVRSLIGPQYAEPVWLWTDSLDGSGNGASIMTDDERGFQPVNLEDKVALIVGGASDTGEKLAVSFAERGMDVAIIFFHERHEQAGSVKEAVEELGRRCLLIHGEGEDAESDEVFARWAMKRILTTLGRLDIYINVSDRPFAFFSGGVAATQPEALGSAFLPRFPIMKEALDQIVG
ncbi:MAG: hypothetical protein ACOC9E_02900 [Chloroflexota bacterium]